MVATGVLQTGVYRTDNLGRSGAVERRMAFGWHPHSASGSVHSTARTFVDDMISGGSNQTWWRGRIQQARRQR
jgi:hypothetical protein